MKAPPAVLPIVEKQAPVNPGRGVAARMVQMQIFVSNSNAPSIQKASAAPKGLCACCGGAPGGLPANATSRAGKKWPEFRMCGPPQPLRLLAQYDLIARGRENLHLRKMFSSKNSFGNRTAWLLQERKPGVAHGWRTSFVYTLRVLREAGPNGKAHASLLITLPGGRTVLFAQR